MTPAYSMECWGDYVYFGGGGGNELKNRIIAYRIDSGNPILTKQVDEVDTGEGVANFLLVPRDVSALFFAKHID